MKLGEQSVNGILCVKFVGFMFEACEIFQFISTDLQSPAIMEVFTDPTDESNALQMIKKIKGEKPHGFYRKLKTHFKKLLPLK